MDSGFEQLKRTWTQLGDEDPLWAVVSHDGRRKGRWDVEAFFQTGEKDVAAYHAILMKHGCSSQLTTILDFGCGVGRLSHAWAKRSQSVVGVDVSPTMIENARRLARALNNVEFRLNDRERLEGTPSNHFELVASHICLQHMPWSMAQRYIEEFARVCRPGGWVAFQVPAARRNPARSRISLIRRWIVDHLPLGLGASYRKWKHGTSAVFEMYYTAPEEVARVAAWAGLTEVHREPDEAAGSGVESYTYFFHKRA